MRIIFILFILISNILSKTTVVNSLSEVDNKIKSEKAKIFFDSELKGIKIKNSFNTSFPSRITKKELNTILSNEDIDKNLLTAINPWNKKGTYVAISCFKNTKVSKHDSKNLCRTYGGKLNVYLSVLKKRKDNKFDVIAKTNKPLDITVLWNYGQLDYGTTHVLKNPHSYDRFDFAPFKIKDDKYAFGLRVSWYEGYAGGGAQYSGLILYMIEKDKIIPILSQPIYSIQDNAGSWNKDGTRKHHIKESEAYIIMQNKKTNGFYNIKVKRKNSNKYRIHIFDKNRNHYVPREILSIRKTKQFLYSKPNMNYRTKMYLIKYDDVEILKSKGNWVYILYKGEKHIKKWIPKSAFVE